jgi:hypothetical protein
MRKGFTTITISTGTAIELTRRKNILAKRKGRAVSYEEALRAMFRGEL